MFVVKQVSQLLGVIRLSIASRNLVFFVYGVVHPQNIIDNIAAVPVNLLVLTKKIGKGILTTAEKRGQVPNTGLS